MESKGPPYYMGSTASLPRGAALLRAYSPAVASLSADRMKSVPADGYMSSPERSSRYEDPYYSQYAARSGSITPVIDEEISDTELLDDSYSLYGMKLPPSGGGVPPRVAPRSPFAPPAAVPPYDATRLRVENMERQLANLTGLVQKALTQPAPGHLQVPGRDSYRDDTYLRSDSKAPKLGKTGCHKSVSFEKSVSFSDEPPDMNSPKQHSPQHTERDGRLKPAPSKPMPLNHSGSYDGSAGPYRDLQLTAETYNQLRCLQKKAKELRAEARNLRRMSQAQAHSVKETVRDAFIKIRAVLMAGGEQLWETGMDQERVRLSREEDLYKQEMMRLEKDLSDLESTVEELRGNVINRKTRVNMSDVENMALILSKSSKTVADLKLRFPGLQDSMKSFLNTEMEKMMREEKFLKEEPERLESALRRCKKLTGTLVTLKRLASVQEQRLPCSNSVDGRLSPSSTETPPITPSSTHSKGVRLGSVTIGGDPSLSPVGGGSPSGGSESGSCGGAGGNSCRPENALDALLDELQTFSRPASASATAAAVGPPGNSATDGGGRSVANRESEQQRKGSMDSQHPYHPPSALQVTPLPLQPGGIGLRRLHSYPSGSDTDNSPPIQPLKASLGATSGGGGKPPLPERTDASGGGATTASGKRMPPPPPPRTSSKSPIASPTSPRLPPRAPVSVNNPAVHNLQHIQNVQQQSTSSDDSSSNSQAIVEEKPALSQFEQATQNLGLQTLRRSRGLSQGGAGGDQSQGGSLQYNSKPSDRSQTLPRNLGSTLLQAAPQPQVVAAVASGDIVSNSSSCESINSQDGGKNKTRKEELEHRHQELLKKQKALQEQYARLQQLQRGPNALAGIPPDQLLKKTGSESNLLQKMGLQLATQQQVTGSLTNLPAKAQQLQQLQQQGGDVGKQENVAKETKVYETEIL
ncbi:unnamed protein product [Acanthoscelides obtectus]|uniref:Actin interacting protein 3-like C-terminal domain-containing protein n=2 Tax=Acanthoscelides obtectus TaxID=200917 RepID=A0A9P0P0J9_ACAOB|nr:unnamed protein product [Acanthoscelides obtectus]CAK1621923.1 Coiled-coil domain-containing protein AGAP005037 [Acanthoscelides obtectus]